MLNRLIFQLAYQVVERLIKVPISAGQKQLSSLVTSNYNLSLNNINKNTFSKDTAKLTGFFVRKNRFHNLKTGSITTNYEFMVSVFKILLNL